MHQWIRKVGEQNLQLHTLEKQKGENRKRAICLPLLKQLLHQTSSHILMPAGEVLTEYQNLTQQPILHLIL